MCKHLELKRITDQVSTTNSHLKSKKVLVLQSSATLTYTATCDWGNRTMSYLVNNKPIAAQPKTKLGLKCIALKQHVPEK